MMQVDINLLPRSSEKKIPYKLGAFVFLLVAALFTAAMYFWGNHYEQKMDTVDQQISNTQALIAAEEAKHEESEAIGSIAILEQAAEWAEHSPIDTVKLMQQLIALLPERGFIQFFSYSEGSDLLLRVQFDTNRDSAYYLNSLLEADWIIDAKLVSLTAEAELPEAAENQESNNLSNSDYVLRYFAEYAISIDRSKVKRNPAAQIAEVDGDDDE
ncbi:hypothetical protein LC048_04390 [Mesobacillus subterraneus]|uniref:hypothetical protein n=1 Tax=Mesobacillus subterraneus TaxID=285983 RepID=UPI00273D2A0B|nr:hypothetical protein [Mesobacillus subterraneus]WLR56188.1 hypothetical protein LC048_04390 [Mesobacillus subterraneus]